MAIEVSLPDLSSMHPRLVWDDIVRATAAVLEQSGRPNPFSFALNVQDLPSFGSGEMHFLIDIGGIPPEVIVRFRRTYDSSRLVELAAIAIAGLGLYHGGGHEIQDVALRGSAADYLIGESGHLLEVGGRSRRSDLAVAWETRWRRLSDRRQGSFYVCAVEFETLSGRLGFAS